MMLVSFLKTSAIFLFDIFTFCTRNRANHSIIFSDEPAISPVIDFTYELDKNFEVQIDGEDYIVPMGFKTDLASIPRFLWSILPPQQADYVAPAILHDFFYETGLVNRRLADSILFCYLRRNGVGVFVSNLMWIAVRLFGKSHYVKPKSA